MDPQWMIALDLGGTDLKAGLLDRDGTLAHFTRRPSRTLESAGAPIEVLVAAAEELRTRAGGRVGGAGLGSPGVIHPGTGAQVGRTAHLPHWEAMPLRETLAARLGLPVSVDNDANCAALAESAIGAARGTRTSITVTLGTGVGCGIVAEGRVLRGAFGGAGELGHLPLGSGRYPCRCGVERCVEPEASASGLVAMAREAGLDAPDAAAVFAAAARGDARATGLVDHMADRLGALLAIAVNLINPEVVVVGGGVAQAGEPLFARLERALGRYALASHRAGLRIVPAALGERAGVIGAGLLAWNAAGAGHAQQHLQASEVEAVRYLIVIEKTKSGFSAYSPDLAGCVAAARTRPSVEREMREAIQFHLEGLRAEGRRVPMPKSYSAYVEIPA